MMRNVRTRRNAINSDQPGPRPSWIPPKLGTRCQRDVRIGFAERRLIPAPVKTECFAEESGRFFKEVSYQGTEVVSQSTLDQLRGNPLRIKTEELGNSDPELQMTREYMSLNVLNSEVISHVSIDSSTEIQEYAGTFEHREDSAYCENAERSPSTNCKAVPLQDDVDIEVIYDKREAEHNYTKNRIWLQYRNPNRENYRSQKDGLPYGSRSTHSSATSIFSQRRRVPNYLAMNRNMAFFKNRMPFSVSLQKNKNTQQSVRRLTDQQEKRSTVQLMPTPPTYSSRFQY